MFETGLRGRDGTRLKSIRESAICPVIHLAPPAPKENDRHIMNHREDAFVKLGLADKGITPAMTRLKVWKLQLEVLRYLCNEWDVQYHPVPEISLCQRGFLKPEFYGKDATHANAAYGELVLNQLESLVV